MSKTPPLQACWSHNLFLLYSFATWHANTGSIALFIHLFVGLFVQSFICSFICSIVHSFIILPYFIWLLLQIKKEAAEVFFFLWLEELKRFAKENDFHSKIIFAKI